jgi:hypothetical protein
MTRSVLREFLLALVVTTTGILIGCGDNGDEDRDSGLIDGGRIDSAVADSGGVDAASDGGDAALDAGDAASDGGDAASDGGDAGDGAAVVTFTTIYTGVMSTRCAIPGCHVPPTPTGALDLSTQALAFQNLVGVDAMGPACGITDFVRVVPGDAEMSLLFLKVSETPPPCGARMPLTGAPLSAEEQALVAAWINAGAQNN